MHTTADIARYIAVVDIAIMESNDHEGYNAADLEDVKTYLIAQWEATDRAGTDWSDAYPTRDPGCNVVPYAPLGPPSDEVPF